MDVAVALVRSYLHFNGYFTVAEYPVFEVVDGESRVATDLDVLALRLPGAGRIVPRRGKGGTDFASVPPDEALESSDDRIEMIIGEVKEGRATLNRGARDPHVLRSALCRFGGVATDEVEGLVEELGRTGVVEVEGGPRVRLMAFGSAEDPYSRGGFTVVTLGHILRVFDGLVDQYWDAMAHAQFKDPAMGFLMMMEKARRVGGE